ncbi:hypothetical protein OROMI_034835 [Orobanche minor]
MTSAEVFSNVLFRQPLSKTGNSSLEQISRVHGNQAVLLALILVECT